MKRFLLFCSGANLEVLEQCPTDQSKYAGIGATILLTSLLASMSGGYALFTVFRSVPVAVLLGMLWGVVIFNLDRVIVSGMRRQRYAWMDVMYAMPRVLLAVLLAIVISRPFELRLFEAEILQKWHRMQLDARNIDRQTIAAGDTARINVLKAENARLGGEIQARDQEFRDAQQAWVKEKEGTAGTRIPGAGPVFAEKQRILESAAGRLQAAETRNRPLIRKNQEEIDRLILAQDSLRARVNAVTDNAGGFLARMEAFGALKRESRAVHLASIFLTLLFITLETAPIMVKLLSNFSQYLPYEELLKQREFEIVEKVRQDMRIRSATLSADARRTIDDHEVVHDAEIELSTKRDKLRRDVELQANEALMQRVAQAQVEIAGQLVEEWKRRELEKIEQGSASYAQQTP
jgi:hypothetical protein